eukprot:11206418-Lingulodinium_polyedra.AAC.1
MWTPSTPCCRLRTEAQSAVSFAVALLRQRTKSLLWNVMGCPGMFAPLLDPATAGPCLEKLKRLNEAWESTLAKGTTALWTKIVSRSMMQWTFVQKVMVLAAERDFGS